MNYGLYLAATGALSSMYRQDVLANNLANMNTVGFKPNVVDLRQRDAARAEGARESATFAEPHALLEQLGGGHLAEPTRVALGQGSLSVTGNDLDLAIEGDGLFVVRFTDGESGLRFTRDGRFTLDDHGRLVMAAGGRPVLDTNDQPIELDPTRTVRVDGAGTVTQDGQQMAQLQIVAPPSSGRLIKTGDGLLRRSDDAPLARIPASSRVHQGHVEASGVDPIKTINAMMSAAKAAQANLKMMQYHDQLLGQVFNTVGRVA